MGKVKSEQVTYTDINTLARAAFTNMADYFKDPEHEKAFEEWKRKREAGRINCT